MYKNILKNVPKLGKISQKYMDEMSELSDRVARQKINDRKMIATGLFTSLQRKRQKGRKWMSYAKKTELCGTRFAEKYYLCGRKKQETKRFTKKSNTS